MEVKIWVILVTSGKSREAQINYNEGQVSYAAYPQVRKGFQPPEKQGLCECQADRHCAVVDSLGLHVDHKLTVAQPGPSPWKDSKRNSECAS